MPGYALPAYAYRTPPEISGGARCTYPVIIAGAGLGGLACALELGSRGIQAVVLDEDDTVGENGEIPVNSHAADEGPELAIVVLLAPNEKAANFVAQGPCFFFDYKDGLTHGHRIGNVARQI